MFEKIFNDLSKKSNAVYTNESYKVDGDLGSKLPITIHYLDYPYQDTIIYLRYELGDYNLAEINIALDQYQGPDFEIRARDQMTRLLSFNKKVWTIKCKNPKLERYLEISLNDTGLTKIARESTFEPEIKGEYKGSIYTLYTCYSLAFQNKEQSIEPIIKFYKMLIDYTNA